MPGHAALTCKALLHDGELANTSCNKHAVVCVYLSSTVLVCSAAPPGLDWYPANMHSAAISFRRKRMSDFKVVTSANWLDFTSAGGLRTV
jgi:hypothetical protein